MRGKPTQPKEKFKVNPFKNEVIKESKFGTRMLYASPGNTDTFALVDKTTGEEDTLNFGKRVKVDKTQFLRLYAAGIKMFLDISSAGCKVFMLIYDELMRNQNWGADSVDLVYYLLEDEVQAKISRTTFLRGIRELVKANFLAPSYQPGKFWINASYVFRGNRITLVQQYILDENAKPLPPKEKQKKQNPDGEQLELFSDTEGNDNNGKGATSQNSTQNMD